VIVDGVNARCPLVALSGRWPASLYVRLGGKSAPHLNHATVCYGLLLTKYIALLRAVNVGGTGKLPMFELKAMCRDAGFARVETYIASGNVIFESEASPSRVKAELEG
jgi:Protein of unknown function (DUF1697)